MKFKPGDIVTHTGGSFTHLRCLTYPSPAQFEPRWDPDSPGLVLATHPTTPEAGDIVGRDSDLLVIVPTGIGWVFSDLVRNVEWTKC